MNPILEFRVYQCEREVHLIRQDRYDILAAHWKAEARPAHLIITEWQGFPDDPGPRGKIRTHYINAPECTDCDPVQELWQQATDRIRQHYRFRNGI